MDKIISRGKGLSRSVLKVMGLFTGTQAAGILCSIVKMKLVALWLHATGVGLFGVFNSTSETISCLTDLGLRQSAVRDVARTAGNRARLVLVAAVVRRWSVFAGLLGAGILCALSPVLSGWFMGSRTQWWQFGLLSISLFLNGIVNGELAIMQGTRRLREIARASVGAAVTGLVLSIPLYRFLGETSVILSVVLYAVATFVWVRYYKVESGNLSALSRKTVWQEGKGFIRLGVCMAIAAFSTNMLNLLFLGYLQGVSSSDAVGLYQSGATIIIRYAGLIFTAVGLEFYPRLAANVKSRHRSELFISHEILLLLLVLVPMVLCFLALRYPIISLLYSKEFIVIVPFVSWAMLSLPLKAMSWGMAYAVVAAGRGKLFLAMEVSDGLLGLGLLIAGYHFGGLTGIGIGFVGWYLCYTLLTYSIFRFHFRMNLRPKTIAAGIISLFICGIGFWVGNEAPGWCIWIYAGFFSAGCLVILRRLWRR